MNKPGFLRFAIVDDERAQAKALANALERFAKEKKRELEVVEFFSGEEFFESGKNKFDLVFLDIDFSKVGGENGMEIAKRMRSRGDETPLVFVTNLASYAIDGYSVGALDFIVKPIVWESFLIKTSRIWDKLFATTGKTIRLQTGSSIRKVAIDRIEFVEVAGHKLTFYSDDEVFDTYMSLSEAEKLINEKTFVRCNVCYLVNLSRVVAVDGNTVRVGEHSLVISRSKKKEFVSALNRYLGGCL